MSKYIGLFLVLIIIALMWAARGEACEPGDEQRIQFRVMPTAQDRLYVGCRGADRAPRTYYADITQDEAAQLRSLGSYMMRTRYTWTQPRSFTAPILLPALTACDRWYLWADDEGPRAPAMTRARKLEQACR